MSWGVYDVDAVVVPADGGVFRQDGNTTLFLLVVRVHDALCAFVFAIEGAGLAQKFINQGSFTMVNVGNNGNVTEFLDHNGGLYCGQLREYRVGHEKRCGIIPTLRRRLNDQ